MWSKLSHKSKAIAFFVGLVFIIILGYVLSLQKTLDLWTENSSLTILTGKSEATIIQEIGLQTRKKQRIDSLLSQLETGASNVETINRLFVISEDHGLSVHGLVDQNKKSNAPLYKLRVEGYYINFVKFLRNMESTIFDVKIESIVVFTERDRKTKKEHLFMEVIFRKIDYGL